MGLVGDLDALLAPHNRARLGAEVDPEVGMSPNSVGDRMGAGVGKAG